MGKAVVYSVNGKFFKDFGVYISDSKGLFDALKRKQPKTYNWAEYHGSQVDLDDVKFESREIELEAFIVGNDWKDMQRKFSLFIAEFQKKGLQRLVINPFVTKKLVYQVYMQEDVKLEKTFRDGEMVGIFSIKLIEPNPIKRVIQPLHATLSLSFSTETYVEIFWEDGTKIEVTGDFSTERQIQKSTSQFEMGDLVVIAGDIDNIKNFSTNGAVLWEKL